MIWEANSSSGADLAKTMADSYEQPGVEHPYVLVDLPSQASEPLTIDGHATLQRHYRIYVGEPAYDLRDV